MYHSCFSISGLKTGIKDYRDFLYDALKDKRYSLPLRDSQGRITCTEETMDDLYVKLAVLDGHTVDNQWLNSDREYHFQRHFQNVKEIEREELMKVSDKQVVISGVAGVGKSTFVNKIVLDWTKGEFFNGEKTPYIGLLIPIRCRELNNIAIKNDTSLISVIKEIHPKLSFLTKKTYEELLKQILIIVDGLDELVGIDTIRKISKEDHANLLYNILIKKNSLTKHRIFVGRPRAARMIQFIFQQNGLHTKSIEICGFDDNGIETYITKMSRENNTQLHQQINNSTTIKTMASIPVYLWAMCGIYHQLQKDEIPETVTELLLFLMLLFQQNHWKQKRDEGMSLSELVQDAEMLQNTKEISAVAFETLSNQEVILRTEKGDKNANYLDDLEKMGFLVRVDNADRKTIWYEFRHLVLQEILSAIHMFLTFGPQKIQRQNLQRQNLQRQNLQRQNLQGCIPLVAGLKGLLFRNEATPVTEFVCNLSKKFKKNKQETEFFNNLITEAVIQWSPTGEKVYLFSYCVYEYQRFTKKAAHEIADIKNRPSTFKFEITPEIKNLHHVVYLIDKFLENSIPLQIWELTLNSFVSEFVKPNTFRRIVQCKTISNLTFGKDLPIDLLSQYIEILRSNTTYSIYATKFIGIETIAKNNFQQISENLSHLLNRVKSIILDSGATPIVVSALSSSLFLSANILSLYNIHIPVELIECSRKFREIKIKNSSISLDGLQRLNKIIKAKKSMKGLHLTFIYRDYEKSIPFSDTLADTMLPSFKYLETLNISYCSLTTRSLYEILKVMFSKDSRLTRVILGGNDFRLQVSEEEEETARNHLESFDYVSCISQYIIDFGSSTDIITAEVFRPLLDILRFNVCILHGCKDLNTVSFNEEICKKASEWNVSDANILFQKLGSYGSSRGPKWVNRKFRT